jgi:catalase
LRGYFEVDNKNLDEKLRLGLFSENKSYPAWVRFSNNTSNPVSNDSDFDLRGIGLKVMSVPGEKILPAEINETTQDFLMFASAIFFVKDIKDYSEFIKALGDGKPVSDLIKRPRSLGQLAKAQIKASFERNPLRLKYFSASPYRLGEVTDPNRRPVKYSFKPCDEKAAKKEPQGDKKDPNFMRETLKRSLGQKDACFHFQVQVADPAYPQVYPVEDPTVRWPEDNQGYEINISSPYVTVATLRIPKQDFDKPELDQFCERLTLTPWHARKEHRPLGRTNRMRRILYETISKYRHEANGVRSSEPTSHEISAQP